MKACELWGYSPIHTFVPQILLSSCHKAHAVLGGVGGACGVHRGDSIPALGELVAWERGGHTVTREPIREEGFWSSSPQAHHMTRDA